MTGDTGTPGAQWQVQDEAAVTALLRALDVATKELSPLAQPVLVAACPWKHDDRGTFHDWMAVQVGRARWERTAYALDAVEEHAVNPDHLPAARAALRHLEKGGWRELTATAFGVKLTDEVLGLILQHGAAWLVIAGTCAGQDAAFLLDASGDRLVHVGEADRLDGRLGHPRPLALERIEPSAWSALHTAAPAFPAPLPLPSTSAARAARRRLAALFGAASSLIRAIPGTVRYASAGHRSANWSKDRGRRVVALDGTEVDNEYMIDLHGRDDGRYAQEIGKGGQGLAALNGLLDVFVAAGWGDLFVEGVMPLEPTDLLALVAHGDEVWMVAAGAVFGLGSDGDVALVGACDEASGHRRASRATIYLFDGRTSTPPEPPLLDRTRNLPPLRAAFVKADG